MIARPGAIATSNMTDFDDEQLRVRVGDAPVRIVHCSLAALVAISWWTAEEHMLDWHRLSGYCILSLVLFRLAWGVLGSHSARFRNFVRGPRAAWRYLRALLA